MKLDELIEKSKGEIETAKQHSYSEKGQVACNIYKEILQDLISVKNEKEYTKILLVEDGSIDEDGEREQLEELGYKVLVYRQGARTPEVLENRKENK